MARSKKDYVARVILLLIPIFLLSFSMSMAEDALESSGVLEEFNESDITTKIYKSTGSSADMFEEETNVDSVIEDDVLSKDELIKHRKNMDSKIVDRTISKSSRIVKDDTCLVLPWIVLVVMILVMGLIFKLIQKKPI